MSSNCGSALNSSQVNVFGFSTNPPISRRQSFNTISGLMPRSRIGKPWVRCWPGGRRSVERPSRTGGFSLAAILRAQRSLRSTKLGLGVAMVRDYKTTGQQDDEVANRTLVVSSPVVLLFHRLPARFELLDGVAQFGGPLVKLLRNCAFHLALHDLEFAERPFRAHFLEPFLEKRDLATFRRKLRKIRFLEKLYDGVAPSLNFAHGVGKFSFMEQERSFRPCVHHQHVGPK